MDKNKDIVDKLLDELYEEIMESMLVFRGEKIQKIE